MIIFHLVGYNLTRSMISFLTTFSVPIQCVIHEGIQFTVATAVTDTGHVTIGEVSESSNVNEMCVAKTCSS